MQLAKVNGSAGGPAGRSDQPLAAKLGEIVRESNENIEKRNAAQARYDLEIELIDRDLEFDLSEAIWACGAEPSLDGVASLIRRAVREFNWHRRYARHVLNHELGR